VRTVNRQCSSGLQAIADVAAAIKAGFYTIGLAGGVETMSANPMAWEVSSGAGARAGRSIGGACMLHVTKSLHATLLGLCLHAASVDPLQGCHEMLQLCAATAVRCASRLLTRVIQPHTSSAASCTAPTWLYMLLACAGHRP
jgi:hypothetical protein